MTPTERGRDGLRAAIEALRVKYAPDDDDQSDLARDLRRILAEHPATGDEERLAVCDRPHGNDGNPARVYGHHASPRTCIRIKATDQWVYDPAWETS